jgi:hypothetical protein
MASDPNQYYQERQQKNRDLVDQQMKGTLETYNLEKQKIGNIPLPPTVVEALAVIGGLAIIYVIADLIF